MNTVLTFGWIHLLFFVLYCYAFYSNRNIILTEVFVVIIRVKCCSKQIKGRFKHLTYPMFPKILDNLNCSLQTILTMQIFRVKIYFARKFYQYAAVWQIQNDLMRIRILLLHFFGVRSEFYLVYKKTNSFDVFKSSNM